MNFNLSQIKPLTQWLEGHVELSFPIATAFTAHYDPIHDNYSQQLPKRRDAQYELRENRSPGRVATYLGAVTPAPVATRNHRYTVTKC
ncbi:hypothetical protein EVAR_99465_1 [Eumeta japonica]|uniref:Uncharacterized protein n=1 Tax=Eumeta variegata TaxID=151549 RepID=A0A4C1Z784_EUMVA|nr:hypothetical protein EVAR_99465_1 [Eumeta japonica]